MSSSAARRPAPGVRCCAATASTVATSPTGGGSARPLAAENERLRRQVERLRTRLERAEKVIAVQGNVSALLRELSLGSADPKDGR